MSTVFKFRMLSDESDYFIREYEVSRDMKLIDLNDFICDDLRFDKHSVTSFFTSDALWEKGHEFTRLDMNAGESDGKEQRAVPMGEVLLSQVVERNPDRLIFVFDVFGDRSLYLEVTEAKTVAEGAKYPRTVLSKGDSPKQFDSGGGIFDDMMNEFDSFDGSDGFTGGDEFDEFGGSFDQSGDDMGEFQAFDN